jgi:hypothetical protein
VASFKYSPTNFTEVRIIDQERIENYDVMRRHDLAMLEYFTMYMPFTDEATNLIREKMVPFVFATPKREYSKDEDNKLTAQVFAGDYHITALEKLVYPHMTLTRLNVMFDQSRWGYGECRNITYSDDLNTVQVGHFPLPYTFMYQIDFLADTFHDMNNFQEQFARKFPRPTWWVDITFPMPWNTQTLHMQTDGVFNNLSTFETGDAQRDLRGSVTINLYGWIPLPTRWVRTVQRYGFDIIDENSGDILQSYLTEAASKLTYWNTGDKNQALEWA